jgi:hypothetical protein
MSSITAVCRLGLLLGFLFQLLSAQQQASFSLFGLVGNLNNDQTIIGSLQIESGRIVRVGKIHDLYVDLGDVGSTPATSDENNHLYIIAINEEFGTVLLVVNTLTNRTKEYETDLYITDLSSPTASGVLYGLGYPGGNTSSVFPVLFSVDLKLGKFRQFGDLHITKYGAGAYHLDRKEWFQVSIQYKTNTATFVRVSGESGKLVGGGNMSLLLSEAFVFYDAKTSRMLILGELENKNFTVSHFFGEIDANGKVSVVSNIAFQGIAHPLITSSAFSLSKRVVMVEISYSFSVDVRHSYFALNVDNGELTLVVNNTAPYEASGLIDIPS